MPSIFSVCFLPKCQSVSSPSSHKNQVKKIYWILLPVEKPAWLDLGVSFRRESGPGLVNIVRFKLPQALRDCELWASLKMAENHWADLSHKKVTQLRINHGKSYMKVTQSSISTDLNSGIIYWLCLFISSDYLYFFSLLSGSQKAQSVKLTWKNGQNGYTLYFTYIWGNSLPCRYI